MTCDGKRHSMTACFTILKLCDRWHDCVNARGQSHNALYVCLQGWPLARQELAVGGSCTHISAQPVTGEK